MKVVLYSSAIGSLYYAQVCIRPDLAFVTELLGRYQSNLGIEIHRDRRNGVLGLSQKTYL